VGCHSSRNLQWNKDVTGETVVVKVTERRWRMKLAGGDPTVRIGPLPADCPLNSSEKSRCGVLRQEVSQSLKEAVGEFSVAIFPYANQQRQSQDKTDGFLRVAVNKSRHAVEFSFTEKQYVTAMRVKRINPSQQVRDSRGGSSSLSGIAERGQKSRGAGHDFRRSNLGWTIARVL
jgi:hypothetical protein